VLDLAVLYGVEAFVEVDGVGAGSAVYDRLRDPDRDGVDPLRSANAIIALVDTLLAVAAPIM